MAVKRYRGKWVVDYTDPNGNRVRRVSPVQTRRGATEYEVELRTDSSTSTNSSTLVVPTVREFAVTWLKTYAATNNKPSELVSKESILRRHVLPHFGNSTLDHIGPQAIERYKAAKLQSGLTAKTVNNHLTVLRKMLDTAAEWGQLDDVPRIRRLPTRPPSYDWLSGQESVLFLEAMKTHYPQWYALFYTALRTGLRRGELFALHWKDVDLSAGALVVRHSVYRGRLVTPKSGRTRWVPLTNRLCDVLRAHRQASLAEIPLVFPSKDGILTRHQDHVERPLRGALKRAGLRTVRFHDLRHSFASQLVSAGRPIREVQELLGHQSVSMTMRYAHLAPGRMREAVDVLEVVAAAG